MNSLIEVVKTKNLKQLTGVVLSNNVEMLNLIKSLGFSISNNKDPTVKTVSKFL